MSTSTPNQPDRITELMVDAATQGLAPQDQAELDAALERDPALRREADAYELAATAVELALTKSDGEALPASLHNKLVTGATDHLPGLAQKMQLVGTPADTPAQSSPDTKPAPQPFSLTDGRAFGWYAAAAALIALVIVLGRQPGETNPTPDNPGPVAEDDTQTNDQPDNTLTDAERYAILASNSTTVRANWVFNEGGENAQGEAVDERFANTTGEVIWSPDDQAGYMRLTGLPINDPDVMQYQLWIVDASRDAEPIDGGVFDITETGEVLIPIDAKLQSDSPTIFAITDEHPGGVVVSDRPLQVLAIVDAG